MVLWPKCAFARNVFGININKELIIAVDAIDAIEDPVLVAYI
jgi:hypothetical protein